MQSANITEQEVELFRKDTKGVAQTIHFNNAGSSLPPDEVLDTVINYLRTEAIHGGYETEAACNDALEHTYELIARLIHAHPDEIALVENASTAWGIAFNGIDFKPGDIILTSEMEYVTNMLGFLHAKQQRDINIQVIPNDGQGNFSLDALEKAITPHTRLIAITHMASTAGGMMPVAAIGKIARQHGILYLVDACQSVGHIPIDVNEIQCDLLSVTGRKYLRAPRGTGFLYIRKEIQDAVTPFLMDGHSATLTSEDSYEFRKDARRFELYEKNRALVLGLSKAVEYALNIGVDRIWTRIQELAGYMRQQMATLPFVTVHDSGDQQCGIVTFSVKDIDSTDVRDRLAKKHINVSVAKAGSALVYMNRHQFTSIVRASVHYYNIKEEIDTLCQALKEI